MRTISYRIGDLKKAVIEIGYVAENEHTRVNIDASEVFSEYPQAVATLTVQPPKGSAYPATVTRNGDTIVWDIKDSDLVNRGQGEIQLTFTEGTVVVKSCISRISISRSIVGNGEAPEPVQDWINDANELLADLEEKRDTDYWKGDPGTPGEPGQPGQDGHTPVLTSNKTGKTTTIYADGQQLAQIQDGQDGQGGAVIDDTTPAQDKVFSSAKVDEELTDVKNHIQGVDDFLGDTSTDLGTHTVTTETDITDMKAGSWTVQSVKFDITKKTIKANGTASANAIRNAQETIEVSAGYYCFSIDHEIKSSGYQIQLMDVSTSPSTTVKSYSSSSTYFDYYFTLESATTLRIRAYVGNGSTANNELHTVTLKKISKEVYENNVAYFIVGMGATERKLYTDIEIGGINSSGQLDPAVTRCRTKDFISIDDFVVCDLTKKPSYDLFVFVYDENKNFIERIPSEWSNTSYTQEDIKTAYQTGKYIKLLFRHHDNADIEPIDIAEMCGVIIVKSNRSSIESLDDFRAKLIRSRFDDQFNYIAYSRLSSGDAPANTAEHFIYCGKQPFTALKGDVRNTLDGGLIMCHDAGYTFDGNNKIIAYNSSNKTLINTLTVAECKALTFAEQYDGQDCHPIDFETFVQICKKYGKICYVTVRDEAIETVVAPNVIDTLKKYRMLDRAIINSFTIATLTKFRELDSSIMLSLVMEQNTAPQTSTIDAVMTLGNCVLNLFDVPLPSGKTLDEVLTGYDPVIRYAINNNVMVYEAQTQNTHTDTLLAHGITGSHMIEIPDYMN